MITVRRVAEFAIALSVVALAFNAGAQDASGASKKPYEPVPGQPGKDSVWVPTPFITLEKMYDLAKLTPKDFVMDLGSGDGRAIIVAAKRGAPGLGIEWNQDLVDLSNKLAAQAGDVILVRVLRFQVAARCGGGDVHLLEIGRLAWNTAQLDGFLRGDNSS